MNNVEAVINKESKPTIVHLNYGLVLDLTLETEKLARVIGTTEML